MNNTNNSIYSHKDNLLILIIITIALFYLFCSSFTLSSLLIGYYEKEIYISNKSIPKSNKSFRAIGFCENWKLIIPKSANTFNLIFSVLQSQLRNYTTNIMNYCTYSFVTLSSNPSPTIIPTSQWDGKSLYGYGNNAIISFNSNNIPTIEKNVAYFHLYSFISILQSKGINAIIAIGGWSDTSETPTTIDDINNLTKLLIELQKQTQCSGFDFDWEHLSAKSETTRKEKLKGLRLLMSNLKNYFKTNNISAEVCYTTRFNGYKSYGNAPSNEEAKDLLNYIGDVTINTIPCDYINIMSYDQSCTTDFNSKCSSSLDKSFTFDVWKDIMDSYKNVSKDKDYTVETFLKANTNIGFEPNPQASGGMNSSKEVLEKTMDKIKNEQYGGILVWAINDTGVSDDKCNPDKGSEAINILNYFMNGIPLQPTKIASKCPPKKPICCFSLITGPGCEDKIKATSNLGICSNDATKTCHYTSVDKDC
jgi:hypothetical protein